MSLARLVDATVYEAFPAGVKEHYAAATDDANKGKFVLETTGDEDTGALKRAKDHEKKKRQDAETARDAAQNALDDLNEKVAAGKLPPAEADALKKSYEARLKTETEKANATVDGYKKFIEKTLVDSTVATLASELSETSPKLLHLPLKARLAVKFDGEEPALTVLDEAGKPTAFGVADLKKEFLDNKDYAAILTGSKASGSGANGAGRGGSGGSGGAKKFGEMNDAERTDFAKRDPAGFKTASEAAKASIFASN